MTYAVARWRREYEDARTLQMPRVSSVPIPNRWDSEAYVALMCEPDAVVLFAVWVWILQVASRCPVRGVLVKDSGVPYDAESLAARVGGQPEWFERGLAYFLAAGWLTSVSSRIDRAGRLRVDPAPRCMMAEDSMRIADHSMRMVEDSNRIDAGLCHHPSPPCEEDLEDSERIPKSAKPLPKAERKTGKASKTAPGPEAPTLEEVMAFALAHQIPPRCAQDYFDYFSRRHWRSVFGRPVESWRARLRQWQADWIKRQPEQQPAPPPALLAAPPANDSKPEVSTPPPQRKDPPEGIQEWLAGMRAAVNGKAVA